MSSAPSPGASSNLSRRHILLVLGLVLGAIAAFCAITVTRIVRESSGDSIASADAIVVFGAAEYAGRPSPVYRARLDHAYNLYLRGVAPMVITTGGQGNDPVFSEGGVGRDYLKRRGIPDRMLIAETQAADTAQSADRVAAIMRANQMRSAIAVSDAYHIFRIKRMMRHQGITTYGSARPASWPGTRSSQISAVARELASYLLWRVYLN
ncbi:MAG: YdcF family protein [Candidatus Korobacteraceae bacterium]